MINIIIVIVTFCYDIIIYVIFISLIIMTLTSK